MYQMTLDLSSFYMQVPSLFLVCFWRLKVPNSLFLASALKLRMKPFQWLCRRVNPTSSIGQNRLTKWCLTPRLLVSFWYMHIRWMYKVCARTNLALSIICSGKVQLNGFLIIFDVISLCLSLSHTHTHIHTHLKSPINLTFLLCINIFEL